MKFILILFFLKLLIRDGIGRPNECIKILSYENNELNFDCSSDYIITADTSSYTIGKPIQGKLQFIKQ